MGVAGDFLPRVLESAGRSIDLRDYQDGILLPETALEDKNAGSSTAKDSNAANRRRRRPLRIGIDVSTWIFRAGFAFGEKLMHDDRHLTSYGRANLRKEQEQQQQQEQHDPSSKADTEAEKQRDYCEACANYVVRRLEILKEGTKANLLVVFDGRTPPIKVATVNQRKKDRHSYQALRDDQSGGMHFNTVEGDGDAAGGKNSNEAARNEFNVEIDVERRMKANRRAGPGKLVPRIVDTIIEKLRRKATNATSLARPPIVDAEDNSRRAVETINEPPAENNGNLAAWMVAPYEADSQLAYLSKLSYIDLVITEDTDLIAHGCRSVLYKCLNNDKLRDDSNSHNDDNATEVHIDITRGKLIEFHDLGGTGVFPSVDVAIPDLTDFSPVMMAVLFVLLGCDYNGHRKLRGIGIVKACNIVRKAFLESGDTETTDSTPEDLSPKNATAKNSLSCLEIVWKEAYDQSYNRGAMYTEEFKREYQKTFVEALWMYRHPIVFDPMIRTCIMIPSPICCDSDDEDDGDSDNCDDHDDVDFGIGGRTGDPELVQGCKEYFELSTDPIRIMQVIGELPPTQDECIAIAEGRSHVQWRLRKPTPIYSKAAPRHGARQRTSPRKHNKRDLSGSPPTSSASKKKQRQSSWSSRRSPRKSLDSDEIAVVAAGGAKKDDRRPPSLAASGEANHAGRVSRNLFGKDTVDNDREESPATKNRSGLQSSPSVHSHASCSNDSGKTVPISISADSRKGSRSEEAAERSPNLLASTTPEPSREGTSTQSSSKATLSMSAASGKDTMVSGSQSSSKATFQSLSQRTTQTQSSSKTTQTPKTPSSSKSVNLLASSSPSQSQSQSQSQSPHFSTQEELPKADLPLGSPSTPVGATVFTQERMMDDNESDPSSETTGMRPPRPPKPTHPSMNGFQTP